jgi:hypothetical protein
MRIVAIVLAAAMLAACTHTAVKTAAPTGQAPVASNGRGLLVQPDVQLSLLTAAGLQERREDWSRAAQANLASAIDSELKQRSQRFEALDPNASMEGRTGQLLRLHEAVGQSVVLFEYSGMPLPTKKGRFDWTLGEGAKVMREQYGADYAMFVTARGTYSSAGRKALMIGMAALGVSVPLGIQQVYASLVDLRTGQVVWFNVATASPNADMRSPEGAQSLAKALLKGAPV